MAAAESSAPPAPPPPPPASRPARRRVLLALTLALPWALLGAAEVALRVAGVGRRPPLFVSYAEAPGWLMTNPDFARRYFAGSTFVPTPHVDFFRADKIKGTYRVFFQGESSAAGFPYGHGAAPSRILHARLAAAFPWQRVEVVNTAFTAVSSYTLLDQADEILAQRPDAVLIYAGHNEWYGQLGAASATGAGRPPALVRAYLAVQRSRLGYLLTRAVTGALAGVRPVGVVRRRRRGARDGDGAHGRRASRAARLAHLRPRAGAVPREPVGAARPLRGARGAGVHRHRGEQRARPTSRS
jgi:hypothetical protein